MLSIDFKSDKDGEALLIKGLSDSLWRVKDINDIAYGTKYTLEKGSAECRFVIYKNKSGNTTKIVVEKSTDEFNSLISKLTSGCLGLSQGGTSSPKVAPPSFFPKREVKDIPEFSIRIGTDETGKGDFFGPIVVVGVCLSKEREDEIKSLNISDSKRHTDSVNKKIKEALLSRLKYDEYSIKVITPDEYNRMVEGGLNVNAILANAHYYVIEDLLSKNRKCKNVIVDQFASEHLLQNRLGSRIKEGMTLLQTPKGERDSAVAAASMIARGVLIDEFLKMSDELGEKIPFGAGSNVDNVASFIFKNDQYKTNIKKYVKINFANVKRLPFAL